MSLILSAINKKCVFLLFIVIVFHRKIIINKIFQSDEVNYINIKVDKEIAGAIFGCVQQLL